MKPIYIDTPLGEIRAYPESEIDYPGIAIMFCPKGTDLEIDLAMVEQDDDKLNIVTWGDVFDEDYTYKTSITKKELDELVKQIGEE